MTSLTAVAHRGHPYRARENTLPSLRSALAAGADAVEFDVRVTRDGVPVLLHDATLERLWGHDRRLPDLGAADLRRLTGGGVPTLREALAEFAAYPAARALVDLPDASAVPAALDEIRDSGMRERVYYCGDTAALFAVRAREAGAEIALTWTTLAPPRPALLSALRPRWLNYRFGLLSGALVARAHADGLLVSAWTPDTRRSMNRLLRHGVDSITTNRIDCLSRLLGRGPGTRRRSRDAAPSAGTP
ncbi:MULTISPECIES: glycerophosphodiester phosphodiesterase [Streptomyces]|uniref:Glycerophosphodiester phosphodiesterase n=1 Tax=Streptomyces lycii TaxID=2654337 RepID=A0ABQ7FE06_9ACTN|nr:MULTISPECIES: glycerophosphodiester phosphodiesterase [Streptomyces]KAF4407055.1 glycerophosphodiester phosphodiesterase [Streptomyces lycii]PGH52486.1 glycerophosphodiester phosphodiesterase [Streptomyces sp. Ru87]